MTGAESSGTDPRIGTLAAGKYKVLRLIGRGGMGSVYEAQNVAIGKRVALKFLRTPAGADASVRARFHREARAVSAIESAHIVQIFDTGETEAGEPFLVMELLQGEDLATRLRRLGRMSVPQAVAIAAQALRGLRRAHAAGVVHRDLKPQNVFLVDADDGKTLVKIVDFGLSKVLGSEAELVAASNLSAQDPLTRVGTPVGTPFYMSPEQIEAQDDIDPRTDIWSMGAILYEALAGAPPFSEPTFARLVIAICHRDAPELGTLVPGLPEAIRHVVQRAMARDRGARFATAEAFLTALLEAVPDLERSQGPGSRTTDPTPPRPPMPTSGADTPMNVRPGPTAPGDVEASHEKSDSGAEAPGAELRTYTVGGATLWLSASPAFSLWRGEVNAPDRLRVETRDGGLFELRLSPVGVLRLGRVERVGDERNELVYPDVASRLAATLRHDGVRWWLRRRTECSVPVQVGAHSLARGEEAALVHGTFVQVGGMRATVVDRRYVTPTVPAGTVDATTGLLGRAGLEQEIASFLQRKRSGALLLVKAQPSAVRAGGAEYPPGAIAAVAIHRASPSVAVGLVEELAVALVTGEAAEVAEKGRAAAASARAAAEGRSFTCGYWTLSGDGSDAGRELELALHAMTAFSETSGQAVAALRSSVPGARVSSVQEVLGASIDTKRTTLLFAIEEQKALEAVGPHVIAALEKELAAVAATHAGQAALVAPMAPGVVAACVTRKVDAVALGSAVQCDWHARPPILDGKVELPRTLSWEVLHGDVQTRAQELARECADPHGVLSALSGGLPYPISGRVHAAIAASSAIERVKMLFDVLEGTWRFIATVLLSAYFARRPAEGSGEAAPGFDAMVELYKRHGSRDGFALGTWREIARAAAKGFEGRDDPIGALVRDVLGVRLSQNQTFETLSNLMQVERNSFAHGHYNEARAAADLPEFEQMTRTLLRALRPLCAWTLVTVEKTEPDLYGDLQTVEFIDHTGAFNTGTRRRLGLNSPMRLANVTYLARWREGLVLPLEPFLRRVAHEDKFDVYWMEHLPRAGTCVMSSVVGGPSIKVPGDVRRLPPLLRIVMERAS
ncbi:serine/threonine-protein kinase [Polyangium jinanense]|uniref:Serine/threonine protein kinase n=1 Tax=Polyangium jinanense TaxID=2829994 RepID=A0A9X3XBC5_9BACT|nr:serine/threonine-protein kinase [Polyangium jinanense]MDC3985858.1 serine/threonine protein kinase [Polyangium jinanense]